MHFNPLQQNKCFHIMSLWFYANLKTNTTFSRQVGLKNYPREIISRVHLTPNLRQLINTTSNVTAIKSCSLFSHQKLMSSTGYLEGNFSSLFILQAIGKCNQEEMNIKIPLGKQLCHHNKVIIIIQLHFVTPPVILMGHSYNSS